MGLCQNHRMAIVPEIDIGQPDPTQLKEIDAACRDHGFFFLSGHGLDALIEQTFEQAERFFSESPELKESIRRTEDGPLGWYDRELTKRFRDCKEVFDFMEPEGELGQRLNRWPGDLPGFREAQLEFFRAFSDLASRTVSIVHEALNTPREIIQDHGGSAASSTVRLDFSESELREMLRPTSVSLTGVGTASGTSIEIDASDLLSLKPTFFLVIRP